MSVRTSALTFNLKPSVIIHSYEGKAPITTSWICFFGMTEATDAEYAQKLKAKQRQLLEDTKGDTQ